MSKYTTNSPIKASKIFVSKRYVGDVENGVFRKKIKNSHFLLKPPALCLAVSSITDAERAGARSIEITNSETGRVYSCTITHFLRYAFTIQRSGYEAQKALPLTYWDITGGDVTFTKPPEYFTTEQAVISESKQLALF